MSRPKQPFNAPFERLKEIVGRKAPAERVVDGKPPPGQAPDALQGEDAARRQGAGSGAAEGEVDEKRLFEEAMAEVVPIARDNLVRRQRPPKRSAARDPEAEALAELDALVSGQAHFDLSWTDEHVEGLARGVNRRILRALRKGEFSHRLHLDLHGLTRKEARPELERFFQEARRRGERCVLVIHGRGLNSEDGVPVLKDALSGWLTRGRIARAVLAFCSARPGDGGLGAVYVLLRK